jgi:hypothetical protein
MRQVDEEVPEEQREAETRGCSEAGGDRLRARPVCDCPEMRVRWLLHAEDLQAPNTSGRLDLDHVAFVVAEQRAADR